MKEQMGKSFYLQKSCRGWNWYCLNIINTVPVTATVKVYQMLKSCLIFENVNESVRYDPYFLLDNSWPATTTTHAYQNQSCVLLCNVFLDFFFVWIYSNMKGIEIAFSCFVFIISQFQYFSSSFSTIRTRNEENINWGCTERSLSW